MRSTLLRSASLAADEPTLVGELFSPFPTGRDKTDRPIVHAKGRLPDVPWRVVIGTVLPILQARGDPVGAEGRVLNHLLCFVVGVCRGRGRPAIAFARQHRPDIDGFLAGLAGLSVSCRDPQDRQCPVKRAGAVVGHSRRQRAAPPSCPWKRQFVSSHSGQGFGFGLRS